MNNKENILKDKSYSFAIRVVKLSQWLVADKKEFGGFYFYDYKAL